MSKFPVIEESVRTRMYISSLKYENSFTSVELMYADSTFFGMFSFDLLSGNKNTCLDSPDKIVITESLARSIFQDEDPLGRMLSLEGEMKMVSAVACDPPVNSSLQFEALAPLSLLYGNNYIGWDGGLHCTTFLKLKQGADIAQLEADMLGYMDEVFNNRAREHGFESLPELQEMKKIHLFTDLDYDFIETGSISRVLTFSFTGFLILMVACFNYVNINTAISIRRTREVGIKKIYGSDRRGII
ncbi:MAG: ABC transporter permease, partial [Marinilabiliaceae bacterium]|nr:ABC transporter permease [Marinilabiliaceae bacterium]